MRTLLQGLLAPEVSVPHPQSLEGFRAVFKRLPELEGPRLLLRAPRMQDADDLYAYARDEENCRYVLWDAHRSLSDSRWALRGLIAGNRRGDPPTFAIVMKAEGRMAGTIGLQSIDLDNRSAEVGYSIARRLWNHGLATEAVRVLTRYAFEQLGLDRLEAKHDVLNPASGRVLEKAGFTAEGVSRGSLLLKGRRADMMRYAILKEDWLKHKGG